MDWNVRRVRVLFSTLGVLVVLALSAPAGMLEPAQDPDDMTKPSKTAPKKKAGKAKVGKKAATKKAEAAKTEPSPAAKSDDDPNVVKFTRDIAPILVANCVGCHNADRKRGEFDLSTFKKLIGGAKGGSEKVLVANNPEESILIQRVKGELEPKMPPGNANLAAEAIEKLEAWVKAGALLDAGVDDGAPLAKIAASPESLRKSKIAKMSTQERDQQTINAGFERLKKVTSSTRLETTPSAHFIVFSTIPTSRIMALSKDMERQLGILKSLLSRPGKPALDVQEKFSLYVFSEQKDYVEFVRGVENREVEDGTYAHANLQVESPYVAAVDPLAGRDSPAEKTSKAKKEQAAARSLSGLVIEQFAVAAANQMGKPPRWLSLGLGAYLASKVEPKATYYRKLKSEVLAQYKLGWNSKATDVLSGQTDDAKIRALGFSLFECLSQNASRMSQFTRGMLDGQEKLDEGIKVVYGIDDRAYFLSNWGEWVASHYGGGV